MFANPTFYQLLLGIHQGKIVLPDLQRVFVWESEQIYLFCDSFFRGYPFGSLLFWRVIGNENPDLTYTYRDFFKQYREKDGIPDGQELVPGEEKMFVLDGQQRLQSAYLCFFGNWNGRDLYLDIVTGQHPYDIEHDLKYYVRFYQEADLQRFYSSPAGQGRKMVRIKDFIELTYEQLENYAENKVDELNIDNKTSAKVKIRNVWTALRDDKRVQLFTIDANMHSLVEATSLTEVAEIFVRVNSGGTRLARSELIFTLLKARWKEARQEFEDLTEQLNSRGNFEVDTDFIIRSLLVFNGYSSRYDIERMRNENIMIEFKNIFEKAKAALLSTFDFLTSNNGAGIKTYRLLTSGQQAHRGYNVLIPIAQFLFLSKSQSIPEDQRRRLRKYLYTAIFSRYMVVYVESHINQLADIVRSSIEAGERLFPLDKIERTIKEWNNYDHISGFFNDKHAINPLLNILHGGKVDFETLHPANSPHKDHIFPKSKLYALGFSEDQINHYANMRLLGGLANILKSDTDPTVILAGFSEQALMQDYLIPKDYLEYSKYQDFLEVRAELIRKEVDRYLEE